MIVDALPMLGKYTGVSRDLLDVMLSFFESEKDNPVPRREVFRDSMFFALVQENPLMAQNAALIEAHKNFADVHVPVSAPETMLCSRLDGLALMEDRRPNEDTLLFRQNPAATSCLVLSKGDFAFFRPDEGHAPCIAPDEAEGRKIIKIVFKIHRELLES